MNDVANAKLKAAPGPLTRTDIADVLISIAGPGEKQDEKREMVKKLCEARGEGTGHNGHLVWDALEDYPEY